MLCIAVTLITLKCVLADNVSSSNGLRIYNGYRVGINGYPHAVFLHFQKTNPKSCGGSLIMTQAVLTAAHCLDELRLRNGRIRAYFGTTIPVDSKMVIDVARYEIHPKYNEDTGNNNLGIAFLMRRVSFKGATKKIPLSKNLPHEGALLYTAGWGYQIEGPRYEAALSIYRHLYSTQQEVLDHKEVANYTGQRTHLTSIYTWYVRGKHARDDAGSGLVSKSPRMLLVGVFSHVMDGGEISVFTNVIQHRPWIQESLEKLYYKVCKGKTKQYYH